MWAFFNENRALFAAALYLAASAVGVSFSFGLFAAYGVNYADYADTGDFLVAAFKSPFTLAYTFFAVGILALLPQFFHWLFWVSQPFFDRVFPWRKRLPWYKSPSDVPETERSANLARMRIIGAIYAVAVLVLVPAWVGVLVGARDSEELTFNSILQGGSAGVDFSCTVKTEDGVKTTDIDGRLLAQVGGYFLVDSSGRAIAVRKSCVDIITHDAVPDGFLDWLEDPQPTPP